MRALDLPPWQRTILITGCSSGIGHHCALSLAKRGYRVFATARQQKDVTALKALGLSAYPLDLENSASIQLALEQILHDSQGQLFALFNNAGYGQPGAVEDISRDLLRRQFEINVFGTLELTNLVLPIMRQQGYGRIIQTSSLLGIINLPFRGAYNATKHALESLTDTLRMELVSVPIEVCSILPGPITSKFRMSAYEKFMNSIAHKQSPYAKVYRLLIKRMANHDQDPPFTLGPDAVERALLHALESKHPKAHYYVTFPTHMLAFLKRCLPDFLFDKILLRIAGEEGRQLMNPPR